MDRDDRTALLNSPVSNEVNPTTTSEDSAYYYAAKPNGASRQVLSIAVVDENPERRNAVVKAVREHADQCIFAEGLFGALGGESAGIDQRRR